MHCPVCENKDLVLLLKKEDLTLIKCLSCGLVQMDNLLTIFDIKYYDYYKYRIGLTSDELYDSITAKRYVDLLNRLEYYRKNNTLLDIGCGEGHFLSVAKKRGWEVRGIEKAPYAVEICKKFGMNVTYADLLKNNLENDYYDAVIMFEVLEHLTQPKEYLLMVNDVLREGGILIIRTPNFNCITRFLLQEKWSLINKQHLFYFTPKTLKLLLAKCDFRILEFKVKHITLPELCRLFKGKISGMYDCNQRIREVVERSKFLFCLKYCMNRILNLTGMGESIECICQKI